MSVTVTVPAGLHARESFGSLLSTTRTVAFGVAYPTGGEPVTLAQLAMNQVLYATADVVARGAGGTASAPVVDVYPLVQTDGSLLLVANVTTDAESDVVEAANASDLTGLVVQTTVYGY